MKKIAIHDVLKVIKFNDSENMRDILLGVYKMTPELLDWASQETSRKEVAGFLGITTSYLGGIIRGQQKPSMPVVIEAVTVCDVIIYFGGIE